MKRTKRWTGITKAHKEYRGEGGWPWVIVIEVPRKMISLYHRVTVTPILPRRKGAS